jgi:hypothetical protein
MLARDVAQKIRDALAGVAGLQVLEIGSDNLLVKDGVSRIEVSVRFIGTEAEYTPKAAHDQYPTEAWKKR